MAGPLMLLDTASLYFRAFHGLPDTLRSPDGTPVNAVRGLLDFIAKLVTDYQPAELVACWDDDWRPQWRVDLIPSYKQHRVAQVVVDGPDVEETPELLDVQIPLIRQVLDAFGIPFVGAPEHEADDVIGSLASQAKGPVDVVTGDRDLFQLVDDARGIRVIYTARGMSKLEVLTESVVREKYGVSAHQYADFAALRGDTSDGLPGVAGVGEKTAAGLLGTFGDLDAIVAASATRGAGMSESVRAKILGAADYLRVAPTVVEVVRTLELDVPDARIRPLSADAAESVRQLAVSLGLGGASDRALRALGNDTPAADEARA
ncbi:5'-3' exonuclease [Mycetocola zhadangensis]|uniref:5'-3' exonuclease n=1 Tax=Mycetocola zhadangensis TaxID=1164595 RepID=A0A3L7IWD4_9MICO|nr:5'-3' exonuclease [Mycetocola zhadangensis]RLQ82534.1 5'-3' exonuclease [Mycetocola zhadangensis]